MVHSETLKPGWTKVKFGEVVRLCKDRSSELFVKQISSSIMLSELPRSTLRWHSANHCSTRLCPQRAIAPRCWLAHPRPTKPAPPTQRDVFIETFVRDALMLSSANVHPRNIATAPLHPEVRHEY
jgi:hypothetical protein